MIGAHGHLQDNRVRPFDRGVGRQIDWRSSTRHSMNTATSERKLSGRVYREGASIHSPTDRPPTAPNDRGHRRALKISRPGQSESILPKIRHDSLAIQRPSQPAADSWSNPECSSLSRSMRRRVVSNSRETGRAAGRRRALGIDAVSVMPSEAVSPPFAAKRSILPTATRVADERRRCRRQVDQELPSLRFELRPADIVLSSRRLGSCLPKRNS